MNVGDPFVRHTAYCFQVLEGVRKDDFNEKGLWPSRDPADVDEPTQEVLVAQLQRWKELVKKYTAVTKMLDPREMFILSIAVQRWAGPILEVGTYKGITTCLMCEVLNSLKRRVQLFTVELLREGYKGPAGDDEYPGENYFKALQQFRSQKALSRVVPIVGDSHKLFPVFWGVRPVLIFLDGDHTEEGVTQDLQMLKNFNHPFICLLHDANLSSVMEPVLKLRSEIPVHFANFHTGASGEKGLVALSRP